MSSKQAVMIERFSCSSCLAIFRSGYARCPLCGSLVTPLEDDDPLLGTTLDRRYEVLECVGEGGMGRVYRAVHKGTGKEHAIKVLFGDHAADPKMRRRMSQEAKAVGKLNHRNVISVSDAAPEDDFSSLFWLAMDFVRGENLARVITREAPFPSQRVAELVEQLCLGLGHAHERGIVHRDFKSENVLITRDVHGELAKIVDFGIAVVLEAAQDGHKLTTEGMVLGTPAFMSPEQATGAQVDARTDLFSLGVLMYEMLCGKLPFDGSPLEIARQNLVSQPPRLAERVPGLEVDSALEDIAFGLMAKRPEDRFQSAADVLRALGKISAGMIHTPAPGQLRQMHGPGLGSTETSFPGSSEALRETSRAPSEPRERVSQMEFEATAHGDAFGPVMTGPMAMRYDTADDRPGTVDRRRSGRAGWVVAGVLLVALGVGGAFAYQRILSDDARALASAAADDGQGDPAALESAAAVDGTDDPMTAGAEREDGDVEPAAAGRDPSADRAGDTAEHADASGDAGDAGDGRVAGKPDEGPSAAAKARRARIAAEKRRRQEAKRRRLARERAARERAARERAAREKAEREKAEREKAERRAREKAAREKASAGDDFGSYKRLYSSVGRALDRANLPDGHKLVRTYFDINYQAGIINQSLMKQNIRRLRWIRAQLARMK